MGTTGASPTKKRLLLILAVAAVIVLAVTLLRGCAGRGPDLDTREGRQSYLLSLGWEIDPGSEAYKPVKLPDKLEGVLSGYNDIQLKQGCDLTKHLGESCAQYSYAVTNYPDPEQTVRVTLYIQNGKLIAGDVHSTALDGFMQGLDRTQP